jgi:hypothetical protein
VKAFALFYLDAREVPRNKSKVSLFAFILIASQFSGFSSTSIGEGSVLPPQSNKGF